MAIQKAVAFCEVHARIAAYELPKGTYAGFDAVMFALPQSVGIST